MIHAYPSCAAGAMTQPLEVGSPLHPCASIMRELMMNVTAEGECGDPTSHPFFNSECRRPNSTFLANEFCSLQGEPRPGQAQPEPQQRLPSSSSPSSPSNEPEVEEREFDEVVAKATNECGDVVKCNDTHTPSALHALGLTIFCLGIVFLIIYL